MPSGRASRDEDQVLEASSFLKAPVTVRDTHAAVERLPGSPEPPGYKRLSLTARRQSKSLRVLGAERARVRRDQQDRPPRTSAQTETGDGINDSSSYDLLL